LRVDGQTNYCCGFVLQVRNLFYFHPKKTDAHDSKNNQKKRRRKKNNIRPSEYFCVNIENNGREKLKSKWEYLSFLAKTYQIPWQSDSDEHTHDFQIK